MNAKNRFDLVYAPQVKTHLQAIERKYHSLIRRTIETQLQFEPNVETRNKKPLKRPAELGADWEIRFGPDNCFRVFYSVEQENWKVFILAIGIKRKNRLTIGREEVNL
ncbi:MAG: addiction module toxin RelE [Deltaproteobacteria bacterium]|nr:addiction module toxin RelE [Deltaproteobacteria bacterium]MBW1738707.1 addiction module toxin RelE [Deltaproteobacteria bacterium]MBW1909167.1 addiction module toxin RelE [Deltaproteobacteria bacterium]MBW2032624.1 addiction module toxin RelE [Deltaproteobacteria bacterium]MBW2113531.1 addiction module toxin RelE [Deltaproteobacteria bacterium]